MWASDCAFRDSLASDVVTRDPLLCPSRSFPTLPPQVPPCNSPLPCCPFLPGVCPGLPPEPRASVPSLHLVSRPQKLLEPGQTPVPQELTTTSTSAQTLHCQTGFSGQPECGEPRPSWVEWRFIFLLTTISQLSSFLRTNPRPRFPWLSLPV